MRKFGLTKENWIGGVSDGLALPCSICNNKVYWDYTVEDEFWERIVSCKYKLSVICISCLDDIAKQNNEDISEYIKLVQFTGIGKTIEFVPVNVFYYNVDGMNER